MKKILVCISLVAGLVGCSTNWHHPTASQAQFQSDSLACQDRANQALPRTIAQIQQPAPVYNPNYSTTCTNFGTGMINCQTDSNTPLYSPQMAQANQAIAQGGSDLGRAFALSNYYDNCMQSKGYSKGMPVNSGAIGKNIDSYQDDSVSCDAAKARGAIDYYNCVNRLKETNAQPPKSSAAYADFNQVANGILVVMKSQCQEPEFNLYFKKTSCNPGDLNLAYTSDGAKASLSEKKQILLIDVENKKHEQSLINAYKTLYPNKSKSSAYISLLVNINSMNDSNIKNLYQQKITWGEYNSKRKEIDSKFKNDSYKIESQN